MLEIDFNKGFIETAPDNLFFKLKSSNQLPFRTVINAIDQAAKDNKIIGIVAHIGDGPFRYADVQEFRNAILRFRKSGKPAIAFSESFGENFPGNSSYYLATSFSSIFLQPSGNLSLTGLLSESIFFKGTLEKLDIEPQLTARKEFKTVRNQFTESGYTHAHKEMSLDIINSISAQFISDIATSRKLNNDSISNLISQGPFDAKRALNSGLIDNLYYKDQVYEQIQKNHKEKTNFIKLSRYIQKAHIISRWKKDIALIYINGTITSGESSYNPFSGEFISGAQTVTSALEAAIKDKSVGAIIMRVNSPGGSYIGSDIIWRQTTLVRKSGKPLIVSMGAVAGSGGYFISMNADKIIANPSTITGSIGVAGGKFVIDQFYGKLGITIDHVFTDSNATIWSPFTRYTEKQWNYINQSIDSVYNDFINKVASGRNLTIDQVQNLAKGKIYTGNKALELGLVDTIGGLSDAIGVAKNLMGALENKTPRLKIFPKRRSLKEKLFRNEYQRSNCIILENVNTCNKQLIDLYKSLFPDNNSTGVNDILKMNDMILY